jgi:alanine-glyoxylate transaminase/serine-glyoxylate transaminase/serine-pyruvate transaminase
MALTNTLSRNDLVLVLECGRFAGIWGEMASFDGVRVETMVAEPGRAIDPAAVAERLAADTGREIRAILMVQTDTASSIRNDVPAIRRALDAADHPALLMVDGIASIGCEPYAMDDWGVDVTVGASQKGLMTPPGLGLVWAGRRALEVHRTADLRTRYWDWTYRSEEGPYYLRFCGTPPVSHLFGLREALRMIVEEGFEARWERHRILADAVRAAVEAWGTPGTPGGIELYALEPSEQANSVTTITTGEIDAGLLSAICRDELGVTLGLGIGDLGAPSFRIGHMGHVNAPMILAVVGTIDAALAAMDAPIGGPGAPAAARTVALGVRPRLQRGGDGGTGSGTR